MARRSWPVAPRMHVAGAAQKISPTQQRSEPPPASIASSSTAAHLETGRRQARARWPATARAPAPRAHPHDVVATARSRCRRRRRARPADSTIACGAYSAAIASTTAGSANPRGHTSAARPASTASTTLVWYSPGARSNSKRRAQAERFVHQPRAGLVAALGQAARSRGRGRGRSPARRSVRTGCGCVDRSISA